MTEEAPSPSWQQLLATAPSVQQVVAMANDFLDRIDAATGLQLPPACRPRPMRNGTDISEYAYDLKRWTHAVPEAQRATFERLVQFFAEAAHRLTFLTGPHRMDSPLIDWTIVAQWEGRE